MSLYHESPEQIDPDAFAPDPPISDAEAELQYAAHLADCRRCEDTSYADDCRRADFAAETERLAERQRAIAAEPPSRFIEALAALSRQANETPRPAA